MGTDPFLCSGIAHPYPFSDPDLLFILPDPLFITRSSLSYPTPIRIGSPINDLDPTYHCV